MKKTVLHLLGFLGLFIVISSCKIEIKTERPNVLIILADDMGFSDIGCFGSEISTPNIDDLAGNGAVFTQFYNTSRCCPSRASLLTGLYSHQAGVGFMDGDLGYPSYQGYLNDRCITLAELLKLNNYRTYGVGKWHVGTKEPYWPGKRGFERFYGSSTSFADYFGLLEGRTMLIDDQKVVPEGTLRKLKNFTYIDISGENGSEWYATDAYTDHAIQYLKEHNKNSNDTPFFMYLAYTAPHWPLQALPEDIAKYQGMYDVGWDTIRARRFKELKKQAILDSQTALSLRDESVIPWENIENKEELSEVMAVYAAMIDRMDQGIGRIIETLKDENQFDNTIILFLSDNGGCPFGPDNSEPGAVMGSPESYRSLGFGWANANNTPFRLFKQYTHEGGISSPLIISYPNKIKMHNLVRNVAHITDIFPTIMNYLDISYPNEYNGKILTELPGLNLQPIIEGNGKSREEPLFWEHCGHKAVRKGDWKLVMADLKKGWELYNIPEDRSEINDLKDQFPEKVDELKSLWYDWANKNGVMEYTVEGGKVNLKPFTEIKE